MNTKFYVWTYDDTATLEEMSEQMNDGDNVYTAETIEDLAKIVKDSTSETIEDGKIFEFDIVSTGTAERVTEYKYMADKC